MILDAFSLQGKVDMVSGCDRVGQGMAVGLAEAGCDIVGINIVEPTRPLARRRWAVVPQLTLICASWRYPAAAGARGGGVRPYDILVNNAGLIDREARSDSAKNWDDVMNLNIKSVFFMSQAAAKRVVPRGTGGKIIHHASMLSFRAGSAPTYGVKSAVMGGPSAGERWAKHGINVNAGAGLYGDQQYPAAAPTNSAAADPRP